MGKFQIFRSDNDGQFYYRLKATNGKIILSGEGYETRQGCANGVESVKENAQLMSSYEITNAKLNYTFVLKAENGEIIGKSENYKTSIARDEGIKSVISNAPDALIKNIYSISSHNQPIPQATQPPQTKAWGTGWLFNAVQTSRIVQTTPTAH